VLQKPADKLHGADGDRLSAVFLSVFGTEGDFTVFKGLDAAVCDRHPVRIAGQVFKNMFRPLDWLALADDPIFFKKGVFQCAKPVGHHLLIEIFDQVFVEKTRDEWMAIFQKHKLMFTSIQTIEEVQNDPQAEVNGYVAPFAHERFGSVRLPGYPVHFSHCSAGMRHAAPAIGQHTEDILRELGYSKNEIEELRREKVVV
jgi:hypothetical protein